MLDVKDSFVVAWEVVFKNETFASWKLHMHKGRVCIRMEMKYTMGWDKPEQPVWAFILLHTCES